MAGIESSRCASLARRGLPVAVCSPLTTQLLLPSDWRISFCDSERYAETAGHRMEVRSARVTAGCEKSSKRAASRTAGVRSSGDALDEGFCGAKEALRTS